MLAFGVPVVVAPSALASRTAKAAHLGDRPLRPGASGPDVRELQLALGKAGFKVKVDGNFGTGTLRAVKRFQRASRLDPSGTVGTLTVKALKRALRGSSANANGGFSDNPNDDGAHHSLGDRIPVKRGMSGHDIRVLQDFLTRAGFKVSVDGEFGTTTEKAVKAFETEQNRPVDGVMDAGDIDALRTLAGQDDPGAGTQPTQLAPGDTAQIGPDGLAIAPASAPDPVKAIIAAGNQIASKPYVYGGGHGKWNDSGYDCSGSVSYALHGAGLLDQALASGDFESWGDAGPGQWVTIYAKASHAYMVVAGIRFDTSGRTKNNTRWQSDMRSSSGYVARHPTGL
ncbi:MAG TPA: peptidoglycan-binding protein [Solirubrobacteraceae bacterium]|nr:peptidoglycan-binding protein [Solirubrobacteraceae bacterium]